MGAAYCRHAYNRQIDFASYIYSSLKIIFLSRKHWGKLFNLKKKTFEWIYLTKNIMGSLFILWHLEIADVNTTVKLYQNFIEKIFIRGILNVTFSEPVFQYII